VKTADAPIVHEAMSIDPVEKQVPPKGEHGASLPVGIKISVENINQDDTKNMMIDTSLKLMMDWRDSRLKFRNLKRGAHNLINSEMQMDQPK